MKTGGLYIGHGQRQSRRTETAPLEGQGVEAMGINYIERKSIDDAFDLRRFVWQGAKDRVNDLTDEQCELLIRHLEEVFEGEEVEDTTINDYVWFEDETWGKAIGLEDEEEDEEDEEEEEEDEEEEDEEEDE